MNKKEFIDAIASQHESLPRAQAVRIVDSEFVTIGSAIKRGRKVQVTGFGTSRQ